MNLVTNDQVTAVMLQMAASSNNLMQVRSSVSAIQDGVKQLLKVTYLECSR